MVTDRGNEAAQYLTPFTRDVRRMKFDDEGYLKMILKKIRDKRNIDFSGYREKILSRRVMKRVMLTKSGSFKKYLSYLNENAIEMDRLMDEMTINVTEFFRDGYVFDSIEKEVIPSVIKKKTEQGKKSIRIWSCASSSGEEAYSILILMAERLGKDLSNYNLKIIGTDIDEEAIKKAKKGVFEEGQFKRLTVARKSLIKKYFYKMGNGRYWIREGWPVYTFFKYHDIIDEAPLNNIDIIFCRNLFIYFNPDLQRSILDKFYASLNKGGFLVLGNVESMHGSLRDKFFEYNRKNRLYIKR